MKRRQKTAKDVCCMFYVVCFSRYLDRIPPLNRVHSLIHGFARMRTDMSNLLVPLLAFSILLYVIHPLFLPRCASPSPHSSSSPYSSPLPSPLPTALAPHAYLQCASLEFLYDDSSMEDVIFSA